MNRRKMIALGAATLVASTIHGHKLSADGFIEITNDGEFITSPMPPDETIVEVRLTDGSICRAWYSCNIMEADDWDFLPVKQDDPDMEPDLDAESIADNVIAWRRAGKITAADVDGARR
jgi:hypothetical protein